MSDSVGAVDHFEPLTGDAWAAIVAEARAMSGLAP